MLLTLMDLILGLASTFAKWNDMMTTAKMATAAFCAGFILKIFVQLKSAMSLKWVCEKLFSFRTNGQLAPCNYYFQVSLMVFMICYSLVISNLSSDNKI